VDRKDGANLYAVPKDNPFVGRQGARPEIWAYGLRNVWRMAFDPSTGELWGGDVGQNAFEEVTLIVRGGNHGWRLREGFSAFKGGALASDMVQPLWDYPRGEGSSITGGFVYRGPGIPALQGAYVCGDWASRRIWALRREVGQERARVRQVAQCPGQLASFGVDRAGELYVCSFDGVIYGLKVK
jgi:glucose/arabinose dehydrogenase